MRSYPYKFEPLEPIAENWSITKLHRDQPTFLKAVMSRSYASLRARYLVDDDLYAMLAQTVDRELVRMQTTPWACDPIDDKIFWEEIKFSIKNQEKVDCILEKVLARYVEEIRSHFSIRCYHLIRRGVQYALVNLLKPDCFKFDFKMWTWHSRSSRLQERLHLTGSLDVVRALAQKGTLILLPTHTSNWDSVIVGLAMHRLGLPPLSWGAGLNLFNHRGFRFCFNKLGVYKIDRRKKTVPYLQVLKNYTGLTLERGCHTLFYPSGTRSRSGAIEAELKLGLLSTPFEAQEHTFMQYGTEATKFFIVPIVLNYHCVFEAEQLIRAFVDVETDSMVQQRCALRYFRFTKNILSKPSEIFVRVGEPLDVIGNRVDIDGRSYDEQGNEVDLYQLFLNLPPKEERKRSDAYVGALSQKIVESYYRNNSVLSSHLVAFVAYELAKNRADFCMDMGKIYVKRTLFMEAFSKTYDSIMTHYKSNKIDLTALLQNGTLDMIASDGLKNLGVYHATRPLLLVDDATLCIQDIRTLFYYHNRLTGYGLEQLFRP